MDDFGRWMRRTFTQGEEHVLPSGERRVRVESSPIVTILASEQVRRLALRLLALSGHAPGPLPAGELEAIRGRAENGKSWESTSQAMRDRAALLSALDSALADLAAAEGEVESLRLLVTDLVHPEGDGREEQARCYRAGVEDATRRCVDVLRGRAGGHREAAAESTPGFPAHDHHAWFAHILDEAARALESPPAPAAAPGGGF